MGSRQMGFTVIELAVVLAIISIMLMCMIPVLSEPIHNAKIAGGVEQAKAIVDACNLVRVTPTSTTVNATNLQVTNTFGPDYNSWTDVSVLKAKLSSNYSLKTVNPFGKPYYFKMSDLTCSVAVELDVLIDGWEGYELETAGAVTRIIVSVSTHNATGPAWVQQQKRILTGEVFR
ncbi:type II secretion system protein [Pseudomonas sp. MWU12-2323]|uniref:type II secretion system protein n=1 Tax=Pseudomonas sp. MWU12-2323 TaxID=2651296 RepID=UPI00128DA2E8|nr:type II secretion system protein [Pseudomonas sp. MWU12-2323]MPQ69299.1 prepilin-type N-terminal cleavage/methylation domain-containing protein [Pseudomonas sp. MWU12-2323]